MLISSFVSPHYGGGIGRHTREIIRGLVSRGDVCVELLVSRKDARRYPEFLSSLRAETVRSLPFSNVTLERLWKSVGWPGIERFVNPRTAVIYAPAHARLPPGRVPTVITIHDVQALEPDLPWSQSRAHRIFRRKWEFWLPKALRESTRILTVSEFTKRRLVELAGADPERIGVVGNGVSDAFFSAGTSLSGSCSDSVIVVGGMRTKKGAAETLAVAQRLIDQRSPLRIEVVGENDPEWVDKAASMPNVRLIGVIDDHALASRLRSSCALLFLSPYEGFGIPAIEAMAAGTPALVANSSSLPEIVGDAGIVVPGSDTNRVVDVLERLRSDSAFREHHVKRGLLHARAFTWEACVGRVVQQLRIAISS